MLPDIRMDTHQHLEQVTNYRDWHIPYHLNALTLREGLESLKALGAPQEEIPLIVRMMENPSGLGIFPGSVDLRQHDCIHLLLGRGLLPKDEAFTIGFTMGSTKRMSTWEERAFSWISRHWYPDVYRFSSEDLEVFKDAVRLGAISHCTPLDQIDFDTMQDMTLLEIRNRTQLEDELILAYYRTEQKRYPRARESQRLLNPEPAYDGKH